MQTQKKYPWADGSNERQPERRYVWWWHGPSQNLSNLPHCWTGLRIWVGARQSQYQQTLNVVLVNVDASNCKLSLQATVDSFQDLVLVIQIPNPTDQIRLFWAPARCGTSSASHLKGYGAETKHIGFCCGSPSVIALGCDVARCSHYISGCKGSSIVFNQTGQAEVAEPGIVFGI